MRTNLLMGRWPPIARYLFGGGRRCRVGGAGVGARAARATPPLGPLWRLAVVTADDEYWERSRAGRSWAGPRPPSRRSLRRWASAKGSGGYLAATAPIVDEKVVVDPQTKGIRFAFAYLVKPKLANPDAVKRLTAKTPAVEVDQKACVYIPRSVALHQDRQDLVLKSSDPVNHNVHLNAFTMCAVQHPAPRERQARPKAGCGKACDAADLRSTPG